VSASLCFVGVAAAVPFGPGSDDSSANTGASSYSKDSKDDSFNSSGSWSERSSYFGSESSSDYHGMLMKASYYSQGRRTASGERFNPNGYTAASRTLPFGTMLRLTNPGTGRSVVVRVNDRGPFVRGRSLDVARGAAVALGMVAQGTANLQVTRVN
jgi:rare lipoprotein A